MQLKHIIERIENLASPDWGEQKMVIFRNLLLLWFLLHTCVLLPKKADFWGSERLVPNFTPQTTLWDQWVSLMQNPLLESYSWVFVFGQIFFLLLALAGKFRVLSMALAFFFTLNLNSAMYTAMDGGNNLSVLLMPLLIVYEVGHSIKSFGNASLDSVGAYLQKVAFRLLQFQLVIVYICSGFYKANGELWQNGMALYYILQSPDYSHDLWGSWLIQYHELLVLGTYMTLGFQLSFPWLVWGQRAAWVLLLGIGIHFLIGALMGLTFFGAIMILCYALFVNEDLIKTILHKFYSIGDRIHVSIFSKS